MPKISELAADTPYGNCLIPFVANPTGTPITRQCTIADLAPILVPILKPFMFPVGCLYCTTVNTNPADPSILGFGTWQMVAQGRALVGLDANDTDFDTPEKQSGAKTVTLTGAQSGLPQHTHTQNPHGHSISDPGHSHLTQRYPTATGGSSGFTIDTSMSGTLANNTLPTASATTGVAVANATAVNQNAGPADAAEPHTNVQPSYVGCVWKRTA